MKTKICYPFMLDSTGGSFISTKLLIKNLDDNFDCQLVFGSDQTAAARARAEGLETTVLPLPSYIRRNFNKNTNIFTEAVIGLLIFPYILKIYRFLSNNSIDIVHANDGLTLVFWGIAAKFAGSTVIWHVRSERSNFWDHLRIFLCDHLIFVAESNKQRFKKDTITRQKSKVIHNGVDMEKYSPNRSTYLHNELDLDPKDNLIGFVGNLVSRKRPMLFVKSAISVLEEEDNVHFVLVGDDRDDYTKQIKTVSRNNGVTDKIHVLGYRTDINKIMPSLDVLVLTSTEHGEAFPRVPLEAMASGTPVLTTDTAGVSEAVVDGKTGIVIKSDPDREIIRNHIQNLLDNPTLWEKFSEESRARAEQEFSAKSYSQEVRKLYEICHSKSTT